LLAGFSVLRPDKPEITVMGSQLSKISTPTKAPAPAELLLTPAEYSKAAKVSLSWLAKARKREQGPPFLKFGRSVRYFPPRLPD
jgi:hypothetical protein